MLQICCRRDRDQDLRSVLNSPHERFFLESVALWRQKRKELASVIYTKNMRFQFTPRRMNTAIPLIGRDGKPQVCRSVPSSASLLRVAIDCFSC